MQDYLFAQGKKFYDAHQPSEAVRVFEKILPDSFYGPVAHILLARSYRNLEQHDRAEAVLKEFLKKNPESPYCDLARSALVDALTAQGKGEALTTLNSMIQAARDTEKPELILAAANLKKRLNEYGDAAANYRKLYLDYPASVPGLKAADELARLAFLGKIPPPVFSEAEQLARAQLLFNNGRFDLASQTYKELLKKNPEDKAIALKMARSLYKDRRNRESINLLKELLQGKLSEKDRMEALYVLSLAYWRIDREKEFETVCREIIDKGPPRLRRKALFNLGAHHMEKQRFNEAEGYFVKLNKSGPDSSVRVDALWRVAWIKYHRKEYAKAATAFRDARTASPGGRIHNAAKYWQARSLERSGRTSEAESLLKDIAQNSPFDYYGIEAARLLKSMGSQFKPSPTARNSLPDLNLSSEHLSSSLVSTATKLMEKGLPEFAVLNLAALPSSMKSLPAIAFLRARAAYAAGQYRAAHDILCGQFGSLAENPPANATKEFVEIAFPRVYRKEIDQTAGKHAVDPYLVWAVIRQESRYDESAVSPAGALGLMQITPDAAGQLARKGKVTATTIAKLADPKENLALGIRILSKNLQSFKGKIVPAIASYNADIGKVREWVRRNGKMKQDEFIESIPYLETRLYVKKVLAGYQAYSLLHRNKDLAGYW
jgi:soluble lytic murein transglycosylase